MSQFVANGDPVISQVVASSEYFQVVAVGYQLFDILVYFGRLLGLASPLAEDNVAGNIASESWIVVDVALHTHDTALFGMLKVVAMAFGNLSVDGLLHPGDLVHHFVAPLLY